MVDIFNHLSSLLCPYYNEKVPHASSSRRSRTCNAQCAGWMVPGGVDDPPQIVNHCIRRQFVFLHRRGTGALFLLSGWPREEGHHGAQSLHLSPRWLLFRRVRSSLRSRLFHHQTTPRYYQRQHALDAVCSCNGATLDDMEIRCELDPGFQKGREFGYGLSGGQSIDDLRLKPHSERPREQFVPWRNRAEYASLQHAVFPRFLIHAQVPSCQTPDGLDRQPRSRGADCTRRG
jgi:hypothetical protein